jgi:hypothetical protein
MKGVYFNEQLKLLYYAKAAYIQDVGFLFDLMKFEQNPVVRNTQQLSDTDSIVATSFNYTETPGNPIITILLNSVGKNVVYVNNEIKSTLPDVVTYKGVDEQGWYWGVRFILLKEILDEIYGKLSLIPGRCITGNIYAGLRHNDNEHFVSIAPFLSQNLSDLKNHTEFMLQ